jgi:hypothetical protein
VRLLVNGLGGCECVREVSHTDEPLLFYDIPRSTLQAGPCCASALAGLSADAPLVWMASSTGMVAVC